jgi:putative ABC transport system permease protein
MMGLGQDLRFALRGFRRNPGLTAVTVLVLALGIGANTAIFSVVDALALRPLPFPAPERLVAIPDGVMYLDFVDVQAQARSLERLALYRSSQVILSAPGEPEVINATVATSDLFSVLGVQPVLGRALAPGDDQPERGRVAVVSHGFWQRRLGADPGVLGRTVAVESYAARIVGVMPPAFRFPLDEPPADLWISLGPEHRDVRQWRGFKSFRSIGRLAPGVALGQAQAEVALIAARLARQFPDANAGRTISLASYDRTVKSGRGAFLIVLAAVGVVLLVACVNVANLQLVRASARRREMAIRSALGAGRGRILGQWMTESLVLALVAGGLGLLVARWGMDLLLALLPADVPRVHAVGLDWRVLLYTLAAAVGTAVVVGVAPALHASRVQPVEGLRDGDRGTTGGLGRLRAALLVFEVALAVVLLLGAGLLVRSFARVVSETPGFDAGGLVVAQLKVPQNRTMYGFHGELQRRLEALPGVRGAAIAREMPYGKVFNSWNFTLDDRPPPPPEKPWWANARGVGHTYLATLGIPVIEGRGFQLSDMREPSVVAVVNQAFARRYWPGGSPLGHHVHAYERDVEIVGVVADTRGTCGQSGCTGPGAARLDRAPEPEIYMPNSGVTLGYLAVRAAGASTASVVASLRAVVQELNPSAVLTEVRTMEEAIDQSLDHRRVVLYLLGAFAALALVLAALGLYGVISFSVTQRTREIGVRMALGAHAGQVRGMVLRQGVHLSVLGLAIGLGASLALTRLLSSQLYGVSATDPATFTVLAAVVLAVSALASLVPAWRATRIDPMVALRQE